MIVLSSRPIAVPRLHTVSVGGSTASFEEPRDRRSDADLLGATTTDAEAFGVFYHRHVDTIMSYFWIRTRDHTLVADLTAETFATALSTISSFDHALGNPSQWLHGIAANTLSDSWRRQKITTRARHRLEMIELVAPTIGWAEIEQADSRLDQDRLDAALNRVPSKNREAVRLRVLNQLSYEQIGHQLGCKPGAARVRVLRGLRRMRSEFDSPTSRQADPTTEASA